MSPRTSPPPDSPTALLASLYAHLHRLVPLLVTVTRSDVAVAAAMLADLRAAVTQVAPALAMVEPACLAALRTALAHVDAEEYCQASSELLAAHRRLGVLLQ